MSARDTVYWQACMEKAERMGQADPWAKTRKRIATIVLLIGWTIFAMAVYQISQFDYEMANFDPYEILQVSYDATAKEIKKKYRYGTLVRSIFKSQSEASNIFVAESCRCNTIRTSRREMRRSS